MDDIFVVEEFPGNLEPSLGSRSFSRFRVSFKENGEPAGGLILSFAIQDSASAKLVNQFALTNTGGEALCEYEVVGLQPFRITAQLL